MRRLLAGLLRRPRGGLAACLCLAALGLLAAASLKIDLFTSRPYPVITVATRLPQSDPRQVELQITRPVEDALRGVLGLRRVYSVSRQGLSRVTLELHTGTSVSDAAQQVRSRLRRLRPKLPRDARPPVIRLYNPAQRPVALLGVSGPGSLGQVGQWARRRLVPALRRLDGVADVVLAGAPEPEILVECDPGRLEALGLTARQVALALNREQWTLPAGRLRLGTSRLPLRTAGRVRDLKELARLPVAAGQGGKVVRLGELASVRESFKDPREVNRLNGRPVVTLAVYRAWGGDLGRMWREIQQVLRRRGGEDQGYRVQVIYSSARSLDRALGRLGRVALLAAAAAALVLFLFLRSLRSTLVALAALPFSVLVALLLLRLMGLRLDLLALSGLALALGILVDNAVVVIEAVHHAWQQGASRREGILQGTVEVASPIAFSTLTTVGAFLPLLVVSDLVRLRLAGFFWGMGLSLMASLAAALVLIPLLLLVLGRPGRAPASHGFLVARPYLSLLRLGMARPWLAMLAAAVFLAGSAWLAGGLSFSSGAPLSLKGYTVVAVTPPGTPRRRSESLLLGLEGRLVSQPGVKRVHTRVWGNQGRITVTLKPGVEPGAALERARRLLPRQKEIQFHLIPLDEAGAGLGTTSLTLNLFGRDLPSLAAYARLLRRRLEKLPQLVDSVLKMGSLVPELQLVLNHRLLGRYGLDAEQVARQVRAHLTGPLALRMLRGDREVEVRVRARRPSGEDVKILDDIYLHGREGVRVPLREVVTLHNAAAPSELFRQDFTRVIRLTLVMRTPDRLRAVALVRRALAGMQAPPGCFWSPDQSIPRLRTTRRQMLTGAALALVLVYLIMVAAGESLAGPLVVMAASPFAAGGAVLGLVLTGFAVSLPVYLGGVILAGMLVNVGLVMLDAMNQRLREGMPPRQAAQEGALRRLRPVMMTTLSTAAAALPLLLDRGEGSGAWAPLALTLAAGLVTSAIFALFVTPVLYPAAAWLDRRLSPSPRPPVTPRAKAAPLEGPPL